MTRFSQGTGFNSKELLDRAVQPVVVEFLEQRQYMTGAMEPQLLTHVDSHAGADVVSENRDIAGATALDAVNSEHKATLTARRAAAIEKSIAHFETVIRNEVHHNLKKADNAKFQQHVATQQANFARRIAREGGTYTPIPFADLLVGTAPLVAPTLSATATVANQVTLTWSSVAGATKYILQTSLNGVNWSTLASQTGTSYVHASLAAGSTHKYRVSATVGTRATPVSTTVTAIVLLAAPVGFQAVTFSGTRVDFSWVPYAHATGYKIERSPDQHTWTALSPNPLTPGTAHSFSDTVVAGNTYYYRLSAISTTGTSATTAVITATTTPGAPVLNATALTATTGTLTWPAITGAANYEVDLSTDGGNTWTPLATQSALTYPLSGLAPDTTTKYRIIAINPAGISVPSNTGTVTTLLAAPTGLAVTALSPTSIGITWNAMTDVTNFKVERSTNQTTWTALTNPSGTAVGTIDTVSAGTLYYYRISAIGTTGTSAISPTVSVLTWPTAPTLTTTANSATQVTLNWTAVTGATSYLILKSADGGVTWSTIASPTGLTYVNTGLTADTTYQYLGYALNAAGPSVAGTPVTGTTLLAAPTGLTATAASTTTVNLAWIPVAHATNYRIERSTDQHTWTALTPNPALIGSSAAYADTTAAASTTYYYRISSVEVAGTSTPSAIVHALTYPGVPATLTASVASSSVINLTWSVVSFSTSYTLETSVDGGVSWSVLATQSGTTYANTQLAPNTSYQYRVSATNATGTGIASSVTTAVSLPLSPTGVSATANSSSSITIAWTSVIGATSYKVERSTDQVIWSALSPNPALTAGATSYADTTANAGANYYYRVSTLVSATSSTPGLVVHALTNPAQPTLTATAASNVQINLSWPAVASATSYLVETSLDGGVTWSTLATPTALTYANAGLTNDTTYQYRVSANNATGSSVASAVRTVTTFLNAPISFTATANSATSVTLNWPVVPDATAYKLERSTDQITWTPTVIGSGSTITYADTTVGGTNYYYRLSATDAAGNSAPSTVVHLLTVPAAPTLAATAISPTQINLSWNSVTGANSYFLESSTDGGITWNTVASPVVTNYANSGLTVGLTYTYRVSASNASGRSAPSGTASTATKLVSPTNFTASAALATEIDLAWTPVANASNYKIERSTDQAVWTVVTPNPALNGASAAYADTQVVAGTTYYYRISTINSAGTSTASTVIHTISRPAAPVITPTVISATQINLTWPAITSATGYKVEVNTTGTWSTLATVTTLFYNDSAESADTVCTYRVSAINASGASAFSNLPTPRTLLPAPSGFAISAASATEVDLTWTAVANATNYKIERSTDGTTWTILSPNPALSQASAAYADTLAVAGTNYFYRLSAIEVAGTSATTPVLQALTYSATPTTLTATSTSATSITLNWTAMRGATSYLLETSPDGSTSWTTVITQAGNSYVNTSLTTDTPYFYRVSSINATGSSAASASPATATTLLVAPASPTATTASATEIDLAWTTVADATNFKIERSLDQTTWTTLAPNPALNSSSVAYNDTTAVAGLTYYYRISAIDAAGTSAPGTIVNATTYAATPTLTATATSFSTVKLNWTASAHATGYFLETSADSGGTWTQITTSGTATTITDTALTADSPYEYRISAIDAGGTGAASTPLTVTTLLAVPAGFSDTAISASEVDLAWSVVTDATNYKIERSTNQSVWTTLSPSPALNGASAAYADTTVSGGTTYYYRVSAMGATGTSTPTSNVNALTYPATPTLSASSTSATVITLSWTPVVGAATYLLESSVDSGTTWVPFTAQAGTTLANTGLTADTSYEYRVSATDASGTGIASSIKTIKTLLGAPTVTAAAATATEIDLSWASVANATAFKVERSLDQVIWTTLAPNPAPSGSATGYNDTTVAAGTTYYYRVSAINNLGSSAASALSHATSYAAAPTLTATSTTALTVNLSWTSSKSATSYFIEKSTDGGSTWSTVITQAAGSGTTYVNTSLTADTTYAYRVSAINGAGTGAASNVISLTTLLAAPSSFTVVAASATEIDLAWAAETDATNYKIERSPNGTSLWTTIIPATPLTGSSAGYADTTVSSGTTYFYRVSSIDAAGTSAPATVASAISYAAPSTLTATAASATSVSLNWTAAVGAATYLVESSTDGGSTWGTVIAQAGTSYVNTLLTADTIYQYRVSGVNAAGTGAPSSIVVVTTLLNAPTGFTAVAGLAGEVDLAWTAVTDATGYKIERSLTGSSAWGTITPVTPLTGASTGYADTSVLKGTTYYYRVSAIDAAGTSAPATTAHALTYSAAPTLSAVAASATTVNLNWNSSFGATTYLLERSADGGSTWTTVITQAGTSYANNSLTPDTSYVYRVSAINATGTGSPSTSVTVSTLLPAPSGTPTAVAVSTTEIDLTWNGVTDATGYKIERSLNNSIWTVLSPSPALTGGSTSYADTTVISGTTYFYRISATNAAGSSAPGTTVSTITISDPPTVTAVAASDTEIDLTWTPVLGAASYAVQMSADGGQTWNTIATPTAPEYANTLLTADTNYEYQVFSVNASGNSDPSAIVTSTTLLAQMTSFAATATSPTAVSLTWTAVTDAANYLIESSPDQTSWIALTTSFTGTSNSFVDSTVTAGSTTYYRITAINANGSSAPSATLTVITPLAAPVGLAAVAASTSQINLTWTLDTDAGLTGLRLETSADGSTGWTAVAVAGPTATSISDIRLTSGTTYYYRLVAVSAGGDSVPSAVVHATTL